MTDMDSLVEEVGAVDFRLKRQERIDDLRESDYQSYDSDADTYMTFEQARRFDELAQRPVFDVDYDGQNEFDIVEMVLDEYPDIEVGFSGQISEQGHLDALYFFVEDSIPYKSREFKQFTELHFVDWLDTDASENFGLDPEEYDGIVAEEVDVDTFYRHPDEDEELWATPSSVNYWVYPDKGETVRMWWD